MRGEGLDKKKMEELRLLTEREIPIQQSNILSSLSSLTHSLLSSKSKSQQSLLNRESIGKLKVELREVEDDLVKALAAKTRKEAERMRAMDCISATRARIEELKRIVEDQKARKNDFAAMMARQCEALSACEQSTNKNKRDVREIEEAMSWYNKILGFRLESGHGVKFIFTNIDSKNPSAEYYFSVRHENDLYTLLECEPPLKGIKEAVQELNISNGLFTFARAMREKFQEAALHGNFPRTTSQVQVTSTICISAPTSSVSSENKSESNLSIIRSEETTRSSKKSSHGEVGKEAHLSPGSASLHRRRSPRFKVKK